jgi:hypothetical protein
VNRHEKIESYGRAHAALVAALPEFPRAMWQWRGSPEQWTIHEIVVHLADSEANSYIRARRLIAEPGSTVMGYDEMKWARALHYLEQSTDEAIELFRWLRGNTYHLIRTLPEAAWANTVIHSESGRMTMDEWLDIYERHVRDHVTQMREVHAAWLKQSQ